MSLKFSISRKCCSLRISSLMLCIFITELKNRQRTLAGRFEIPFHQLKLFACFYMFQILLEVLNLCACIFRTCTPPSVSWTLRACVISLRCHCVVLLLNCTTAWPNCCATRCRDPSRATRPTVCWRMTTRKRMKPQCEILLNRALKYTPIITRDLWTPKWRSDPWITAYICPCPLFLYWQCLLLLLKTSVS